MLNSYLETEVLSATPQKLRLMLVDGALRFARQTIDCWQRGDAAAAAHALARCRAIVMELLSSVRTDRGACEFIIDHAAGQPSLPAGQRQTEIDSLHKFSRNTAAIYLLVLRDLNEAQLHQDAAKIESAIRVLQVERETLQLVCEQLPHAPQLTRGQQPEEITANQAAAAMPGIPAASSGGPLVYGEACRPRGSLSLDA